MELIGKFQNCLVSIRIGTIKRDHSVLKEKGKRKENGILKRRKYCNYEIFCNLYEEYIILGEKGIVS